MIDSFRIHSGDCLETLKWMASESVDCCVTSPPYFGLRDYGMDGQIGHEPTPDEFVARLVGVFREVRRVLKPRGTCWVNLGDSYNSAASGMNGLSGTLDGGVLCGGSGTTAGRQKLIDGLKTKDLIGVPWRFALAAQADGWYLRQDIIWHKPNPMPESVKDRCTKAHEYVFLLTKSDRYWWDQQAMAEQCIKGAAGSVFNAGKTITHQLGRVSTAVRKESFTRNRRSVWTIPTQATPEAHFATFPVELPELCIRAGCPIGGLVLDPFNGAGTTGLAALKNGRRYVGIELNPEYVQMTVDRVRRMMPLFSQQIATEVRNESHTT